MLLESRVGGEFLVQFVGKVDFGALPLGFAKFVNLDFQCQCRQCLVDDDRTRSGCRYVVRVFGRISNRVCADGVVVKIVVVGNGHVYRAVNLVGCAYAQHKVDFFTRVDGDLRGDYADYGSLGGAVSGALVLARFVGAIGRAFAALFALVLTLMSVVVCVVTSRKNERAHHYRNKHQSDNQFLVFHLLPPLFFILKMQTSHL